MTQNSKSKKFIGKYNYIKVDTNVKKKNGTEIIDKNKNNTNKMSKVNKEQIGPI